MTAISVQRRQPSSTITRTQLDTHTAWYAKLDATIASLQLLLSPTQANSKQWRPVNPTGSSQPAQKSGNGSISDADALLASTSQHRLDSESLVVPSPYAVKVHRRSTTKAAATSKDGAGSSGLLPPGSSQTADIYRAVCHIPLPKQAATSDDAFSDLRDSFRRLLTTPECRPLWDHLVEDCELIEELDAATRICRTIFRLGWPASHRDAIMISRTINDGQTLMDVSTSLPRSPDAPAYLRPAPPYVRSHVNLFAWCLQKGNNSTLKVTLFWSWDLKGAWLGMPAGGLGAQLPHVMSSMVAHVNKDSARIPYLSRFGRDVEVTERKFDHTRDMISVDYQAICEPGLADGETDDDFALLWSLPAAEGWDVHVDVRPLIGSPTSQASNSWQLKATRDRRGEEWKSSMVQVRLLHGSEGARAELELGLRGKVTIQRIAASHEVRLRVNDAPCNIEEVEAEQPAAEVEPIVEKAVERSATLDDAASVSGISLRSEHSTVNGDDIIRRVGTPASMIERSVAPSPVFYNGKPPPDRSQALTNLIRRNYIYFTSLLQEPEAKWKAYSDSRGVTITQLDSIDPTLVVYRAEATFVGVSVWDIFATLGNPGVKSAWDKGAEETNLVEDVGDASKLWWSKTRAAWPVSSRDSVTVETTYKSPSSIHVFSFSTDDRGLFSSLPKVEMGTIRTQIDLRGWSIESLSPTTVHITLIEQSDPKGWTSKSSATPAAMISAVAGVGDFAIKSGAPPIATRLLGAKMKVAKYEHDKAALRLEYELNPSVTGHEEGSDAGHVECEIRCDMETWCSGLDLVVDPPPINVSCLRRHKLSQGGSGLWLTIEHVAASLEDDTAKVTVRKAAPAKEKGVVHVNGARIKVDVDELKEDEVALLKDKKRTKPKRIPLDLVNSSPKAAPPSKRNIGIATGTVEGVSTGLAAATGNNVSSSTPVSRAGTPALPSGSENQPQIVSEGNDVFSDERPRQPMTCALDVLFLLRRIHAERGPDPAGNPAGWALVSQRNGLYIRRRIMQSISSTVHVQRGDKVVEGLTAEDILSAISSLDCRKLWDDKVDSSVLLESYGNGATTGFFTTKASFPFRGRAFHLASLTARSGPSSMNLGTPTVFFHASASYSERNSPFSMAKLNPTALPFGKVLIDGWILETLDPYSSTRYQIPSTRCTHVVAVDYAGSLPIAVNTIWNANLPKSILAVEDYVKNRGALPSIRSPPCCVEVLGDGRDEDRNLVWNLEDDTSKRACTLLTNRFHPGDKLFAVLVKMDRKNIAKEGPTLPALAVPFPRRALPSNASTTKGAASQALASSSSIGDISAEHDGEAGQADESFSSMSRATSVNSIRSLSSKSRLSVSRTSGQKKPVNLILMDVEVELRHYEKGYEIVVSSELDSTSDEEHSHGDPKEPIPLSATPAAAQDLPLSVSCYDLPPSAVLAATLDPSARPRKHLLRVSLPTAEIEQDSLQDAPKWYQSLREKGASIRLVVRPMEGKQQSISVPEDSASSTPNNEIDSQHVPVLFQGQRLEITHVNQTSAMLQRESEKEESHAILKRVAPSKLDVDRREEDERLPGLLKYPTAAALEFKELASAGTGVGDTTSGLLSTASSSTEFPDPATPMAANTPLSKPTEGQTLSIPSSSTPIMSILNTYPLSRLGASTAVTTAVANGGVFSKTSSAQAKQRLQGGVGKDIRSGDHDATDSSASKPNGLQDGADTELVPGNLVMATTETIRRSIKDVRFTLSTLILVAIIAFLFGSLVRSLLEPADFMLVQSLKDVSTSTTTSSRAGSLAQERARDEVKRILNAPPSPAVVVRRLQRLVELPMLGGQYNLLVGAAQR